jgi:2-haloacid dehalogenase
LVNRGEARNIQMDHQITATVQVLAFDVFGTVVDWRSSIVAEGERLGREKGLEIDWPAFADAWRAAYRPSLNRVASGDLPWMKLDLLHRMSLEEILKRFGINGLSEKEKDHLTRVWHRLKPWPDAVAGLQRLKTRFVIATLSNGNISLLTNMAKNAGLPWDLILSAENVRHYKPDPEVYRLVANLFDLQPEQTMLVAAHDHDLQAAQKCGLRTAYVHRPLEHGPNEATSLPATGRYDFVARDFLDLADQLT